MGSRPISLPDDAGVVVATLTIARLGCSLVSRRVASVAPVEETHVDEHDVRIGLVDG